MSQEPWAPKDVLSPGASWTDRDQDGPVLSLFLYRPCGWSVIEAAGEMDTQCVETLRALLSVAGQTVVLDVRKVTFMDASGLGVLAAGGHAARRRGGALRLVGASRQVRRIVALTQLDQVLPTFDTLDEAMTEPCPPRLTSLG